MQDRNKREMQKIQKFQFGRIYCASHSQKTYELIDRDGHRLVFRVRRPKDQMTHKVRATSTYKADETGAFEEVLLQDGSRIRSDSGTVKAGCIYPLAA